MLTKKQIAKLRRLIRNHVNARIELSWKGSTHPEDWAYIEKTARRASEKLHAYIKELGE